MRTHWLMAAALLATAGTVSSASAQQACPPGYTLVEKTCYRDVVHYCCKVVPDKIKKSKLVYDMKLVPYCVAKCNLCDGCLFDGCWKQDCNGCTHEPPPRCGKVRFKKVLLKKVVTTECPGWKLVVEKKCDRVPYTIYEMVPCGTQPAAESCAVRPIVPADTLDSPLTLPRGSSIYTETSSSPVVLPHN